MTQNERLDYLVRYLAAERPGTVVPPDGGEKRALLRGLMNLRPPAPISPDWLRIQDEFLREESMARGVVDSSLLPAVPGDPRLVLWQGDIVRLRADAVVNAANSALLGCFHPCHDCCDNVIHSAAGLQLRQACHELMEAQGREEPPGRAKLTPGFNLPAKYVLHTVGPIVDGPLRPSHRRALADCYRACLAAAGAAGCRSVAFCCISTGVYRFPNRQAAEIAVSTVRETLRRISGIERVIFNVFKDTDLSIYQELLG